MACGLKRIIQLSGAIQYGDIRVISNQTDITKSCEYAWSYDGVCWINWTNIESYHQICKMMESDFYFRIRISNHFDTIIVNGIPTTNYNVCLDSESTFLTDFCGDVNLFQPYNNLDCALQLQQQLADSVVCMFGIPVYYFRVNPNKDTADYTFKEYALRHIESVKQLKLMITDGAMPSSNPKLTEFDFDWETDWETEFSKTQFATAFGDDAYPKAGDFLYIPMMKRMWEVNSAYDEKNEGLMWRSTTWKLALVKYTESTNVDSNGYDDLIDNLVQQYDVVFGEVERNERERLVGSTPLSSPSFAATNLFDIFMEDAVRKQYTKQDTTILDKTYNHRANVLGRNVYKFKNENGCVVYQNSICKDSGTLMFIIETGGTLNGELERDILNFGNCQIRIQYSDQKFILRFNDLDQQLDPFKSYMVFAKWNRDTFSSELCVYEYKHPLDVPVYRVRPEMYWFDFENPICEKISIYNNDWVLRGPLPCKVHSYPLLITNIKYYDVYLDKVDSVKESVKYTTKHESCIINDLARPINSGHGYTVK